MKKKAVEKAKEVISLLLMGGKKEDHIFSNADTIDDVVGLYKNITFSLYRLEQELPLSYQDDEIQYLTDMNISPTVLWGIAEDKIINEDAFLKALMDGFSRNIAVI